MVESARVESDSVQDVWKINTVHFLGVLVFKEQMYDTFLLQRNISGSSPSLGPQT